MIQFACTQCGTQLAAPDGSEGGKCDCPTCKTRLTIPGTPPQPREAVVSAPPEPPPPAPYYPDPPPRPSKVKGDRRPDRDYEDEEDERDHRGGRGRGFRCPYCGCRERPTTQERISTAGWVVFGVLLSIGCLPLFWIGLLMKENVKCCRDCGVRMDL